MDVSISCGSVDPSVARDVPVLDKFLYQFLHLESPFIQVVGWRHHICTWPRIRRWRVSGPASTVRQPLWDFLLVFGRQFIFIFLQAQSLWLDSPLRQVGNLQPQPPSLNILLAPAFSPAVPQLLHTLWSGIYPWYLKREMGPEASRWGWEKGTQSFWPK